MVYIQEQARRRGTSVGCRVDDKGNMRPRLQVMMMILLWLLSLSF